MKQAVEFVAEIKDGKIEVPEQYRGEGSQVRVLLFWLDGKAYDSRGSSGLGVLVRRQLGQDQGLFQVHEDFDAPLLDHRPHSFEG